MVAGSPGPGTHRLQINPAECPSKAFAQALKRELEGLAPGALPLERATSQGGQVDDNSISVTVLSVREHGAGILARTGVFFNEIVGGCSCGDDPVSANVYCEIEVSIDSTSAEAQFRLVGG